MSRRQAGLDGGGTLAEDAGGGARLAPLLVTPQTELRFELASAARTQRVEDE